MKPQIEWKIEILRHLFCVCWEMLTVGILSSIGGFFWLQMWIILYKCPFRISIYMIETLRDLRKSVVLFYMTSDLLTYLKFQYSKVIQCTLFFYWCGFENSQVSNLQMLPKNISLCLEHASTFTFFLFLFWIIFKTYWFANIVYISKKKDLKKNKGGA